MEDKKKQIVELAQEEFKRYGIKSVSIDDLSRSLGISKKTFYQYFPAKDDLVRAVLVQKFATVNENATKFMEGRSATECVRLIMEMHSKIDDVHKEPAFSYDLRKYYPTLYKEHVKAVNILTKEILRHHLQQGKDEGVYREDLDVEMCAIMYSLIQQAFMRNEGDIKSVSPRRLMRFTTESFFRSIVSEKGAEVFRNMKIL